MSNIPLLRRFLVNRLSSSQTFRSLPIIDEGRLTGADLTLGQPTRPHSALEDVLPSVYIQAVIIGVRRCFVQGWLTYQKGVGAPADLVIALEDGSQPVRLPGPARRAELHRSENGNGRFGFSVLFEFDAAQTILNRLQVSLDGRTPMLVNCSEVTWSNLHCTLTVGLDGLAGKVVDLDGPSIDVPAEVLVNGHRIGAVDWIQSDRCETEVWTEAGQAPVALTMRMPEVLSRLRRHAPTTRLSPKSASTVILSRATGEVIASVPMMLIGSGRGKLEVANQVIVAGWAVADDSTKPAEVDVYVNGIRYASTTANRARQDLKAKGIADNWGGFRISLANPTTDISDVRISAALSHSADDLPGSGIIVGLPCEKGAEFRKIYALTHVGHRRAVSVIIPIFNAFPELQVCVASILRCTRRGTRIILLNDRSTDPRIEQFLHGLAAYPDVIAVHNEQNLGFTKTINKGLALCEADDVILLNSDTIVADYWIEGLRSAAYCGPLVATATPLSNNAGVYSVPEMNLDNVYPDEMTVDEVAQLVHRMSVAVFPRVPTGNGFCMFIRRDAIEAVGVLDEVAFPVGYGEENDFCMRCLRAGWEHVCDDRTFIFHKRSASFGASKTAMYRSGRAVVNERYPEYSGLIREFETGRSMRGVRWRMRAALSRLAEEGLEQRPRILFVISTLTGGTPQTNHDLMAALDDRYECWVLRCDSRSVEIGRFDGSNLINVETSALRHRIGPAIHRLEEYNEIVFAILIRYGFRLIHIRHVGWHGLDLPALAGRLGIPVIMSFHDYYAVCPSVKLLDRSGTYCGGTCTADTRDCEVELWDRSDLPQLKHAFVYRWRENISSAFPLCTAFVTTSQSAKAVMMANFPSLRESRFHVIPHGRSFTSMVAEAQSPEPNESVRVLVPGNISGAKGALLIAEMLDAADIERVEFHILGDAGRLKARKGLVCHGGYRREQFADFVRGIRPAVGVVLSTWPETYCHTLTEMWSCGVPVLGLDIGAVGERIAVHGGGWLLPVKATAPEILRRLSELGRDRAAIKVAVRDVIKWQENYGCFYDTRYMAMLYEAVYVDAVSANSMGRKENCPIAVPKIAFINMTLPNRAPYQWGFASLRLGFNWHAISSPAIDLDLAVVLLNRDLVSECPTIVRACSARGLKVVLIVETRCLLDEVLPEHDFTTSLFTDVLVVDVLGWRACLDRLLATIRKAAPSVAA